MGYQSIGGSNPPSPLAPPISPGEQAGSESLRGLPDPGHRGPSQAPAYGSSSLAVRWSGPLVDRSLRSQRDISIYLTATTDVCAPRMPRGVPSRAMPATDRPDGPRQFGPPCAIPDSSSVDTPAPPSADRSPMRPSRPLSHLTPQPKREAFMPTTFDTLHDVPPGGQTYSQTDRRTDVGSHRPTSGSVGSSCSRRATGPRPPCSSQSRW
jgi:hypothetical protein